MIADSDIELRLIDRQNITFTPSNMKINNDATKVMALSRSQNIPQPITSNSKILEQENKLKSQNYAYLNKLNVFC